MSLHRSNCSFHEAICTYEVAKGGGGGFGLGGYAVIIAMDKLPHAGTLLGHGH